MSLWIESYINKDIQVDHIRSIQVVGSSVNCNCSDGSIHPLAKCDTPEEATRVKERIMQKISSRRIRQEDIKGF